MPFFSSTPKSTFKLDLKRNKYVPVIASFDAEGHCKPLYFRYTYPDGSSEKVAIDRVEKFENNRLFGIKYYCVITLNNIQMIVILLYMKEDNRWALRLY
jgi:hypothetical protein